MLKQLKKRWHELAHEKPGHRFQNRYHRMKQEHRGRGRALRIGAAIVLLIVGVVLLVIPGPGSVFIILGGAFLAEESEITARWLDQVELRLRGLATATKNRWRRAGLFSRTAVITIALAALAALVTFGYRLLQSYF